MGDLHREYTRPPVNTLTTAIARDPSGLVYSWFVLRVFKAATTTCCMSLFSKIRPRSKDSTEPAGGTVEIPAAASTIA